MPRTKNKAFDDDHFKLRSELVPRSMWNKGLRYDLGEYQWGKLRKKLIAERGTSCEICGYENGRQICHEVWDYINETKIMKLVGFKLVCTLCNLAIHNGFASTQTWVNEDELNEHIMKVNNCTLVEWNEHVQKDHSLWSKRSGYEWKLDYSWYEELIGEKVIIKHTYETEKIFGNREWLKIVSERFTKVQNDHLIPSYKCGGNPNHYDLRPYIQGNQLVVKCKHRKCTYVMEDFPLFLNKAWNDEEKAIKECVGHESGTVTG